MPDRPLYASLMPHAHIHAYMQQQKSLIQRPIFTVFVPRQQRALAISDKLEKTLILKARRRQAPVSASLILRRFFLGPLSLYQSASRRHASCAICAMMRHAYTRLVGTGRRARFHEIHRLGEINNIITHSRATTTEITGLFRRHQAFLC